MPSSPTSLRRSGSDTRYRLDRLGWVGIGLVTVQGVALVLWSVLLWHRFALSYDFSVYHQAWWLISHGTFDPFDTLLRRPFWQNNFELMMWPLAVLGVVWPHGPVLSVVQDACLVIAEIVAWRWIREIADERRNGSGRFIAAAGLVVLLADPWAWWSISFDFHMELVALPLVLLAAYDLAHQRRRAWLWIVLALCCGDVAAIWISGIGLGRCLAGPRWRDRRRGLFVVLAGGGWTLVVTAIHGNAAVGLSTMYGYLANGSLTKRATIATIAQSIVGHPSRAAAVLWSRRLDLWANIAPAGAIGIASPWVIGLVAPIVLANDLASYRLFATPTFQSVPLYLAVPIGTVAVLIWLGRRISWLARGVAVVVVVNSLAWASIWMPQLKSSWLRVPSSAAVALHRAERLIPANAEVVAAQGIMGRFTDRRFVYPIISPGAVVPIETRQVWWVVAPGVGIETVPAIDQVALLEKLAGPLGAHLIFESQGIWLFRWSPASRVRSVLLPRQVGRIPTWALPGAAGSPDLVGPVSRWHLGSTSAAGYVLAGDYWREPPGLYQADVRFASTVRVNVEVWNATGDVLLARRTVLATNGLETLHIAVDATRFYRETAYSGWGLFRDLPVAALPGNSLEVRIWSGGHGVVDVEGVGLRSDG